MNSGTKIQEKKLLKKIEQSLWVQKQEIKLEFVELAVLLISHSPCLLVVLESIIQESLSTKWSMVELYLYLR